MADLCPWLPPIGTVDLCEVTMRDVFAFVSALGLFAIVATLFVVVLISVDGTLEEWRARRRARKGGR